AGRDTIGARRAGTFRRRRRLPRNHRRDSRRCVPRRHRPPLPRYRRALEGRVEHRFAAARRCARGRAGPAGRQRRRDGDSGAAEDQGSHRRDARAGGGGARGRNRARQHQGKDERRDGRDRARRRDRRPCHRIGPQRMRVRFAPSPTGKLHVGNARTALFNWLLARGQGGRFVLRIEDTDAERSTRESEAAITRDLSWLGLDWDEGPDVDGPHGPYRQSERLHLYASYAAELLAADKAYHCFCSTAQLEAERQEALATGRPAHYAGTCRRLSKAQAAARMAAGERPAIRFRVPHEHDVVFTDAVRGEVRFQSEVIGDPVIVRADGHPAYNSGVVVDDAWMEITHVIGGEDHISNTPRQLLLYEALGFTPPIFAHLSMVMGPDHAPLSKRHGATSVGEFRARG